MSANVPTIYVDNKDFDKSRLCVLDIKRNQSKKKPGAHPWFTSEGRYINNKGEKCILYFNLNPQNIFGININYDMDVEKEKRTIDDQVGLQVGYPLTSRDTIDEPTKGEINTKEIFDSIYQVVWDKIDEMCKSGETEYNGVTIPGPTVNSYASAVMNGKKEKAIKPIYVFSTSDDKNTGKKIPDLTKPQRSYLKLLTIGKGRDMKCTTRIDGPGNRRLSYTDCIEKPGNASIVCMWDGVFYGSHGAQTYGASIKIKICEMNFTPTSKGPTRKFLQPNTDPVEEEEEEFEHQKPDPNNPPPLQEVKLDGNIKILDKKDEENKQSDFTRPDYEEDPVDEEREEQEKQEKKKVITASKRKELIDSKRGKKK
jgi:hypothetical protein